MGGFPVLAAPARAMLLNALPTAGTTRATDGILRIDRNVHNQTSKHSMRITVIVIAFACLGPGLLTAEEPSPSPTPISRHHAPRSGPVRRLNYLERRRESEARAGAAEAKAQAQASRSSAAAAQAQTKAADRAREQAERQLRAEARIETRNQIPRANSDLMSRMGFSQEEIAAQKAREQSATSGAKEATAAPSPPQRQQEQSTPSKAPGAVGDHSTVSPAKADTVAPQKPISVLPTADPDSH